MNGMLTSLVAGQILLGSDFPYQQSLFNEHGSSVFEAIAILQPLREVGLEEREVVGKIHRQRMQVTIREARVLSASSKPPGVVRAVTPVDLRREYKAKGPEFSPDRRCLLLASLGDETSLRLSWEHFLQRNSAIQPGIEGRGYAHLERKHPT
jgi:hypothetical protein